MPKRKGPSAQSGPKDPPRSSKHTEHILASSNFSLDRPELGRLSQDKTSAFYMPDVVSFLRRWCSSRAHREKWRRVLRKFWLSVRDYDLQWPTERREQNPGEYRREHPYLSLRQDFLPDRCPLDLSLVILSIWRDLNCSASDEEVNDGVVQGIYPESFRVLWNLVQLWGNEIFIRRVWDYCRDSGFFGEASQTEQTGDHALSGKLAVRLAAASGGNVLETKTPLLKNARLIYEKLKSLPEHQAMTRPEILNWLAKECEIYLDEGEFNRLRKELKTRGLKNRPRVGYYIREG
jgi:hypothetical protein